MYILPLSLALNLHTRNMKMAKKIAPATEINVITRVDNFFPPPIYKRRSKKRSKNMSKITKPRYRAAMYVQKFPLVVSFSTSLDHYNDEFYYKSTTKWCPDSTSLSFLCYVLHFQ